jgi:hypothetical protein
MTTGIGSWPGSWRPEGETGPTKRQQPPGGLSDLHHFDDVLLCDRWHRRVRGRQSNRDQDKRSLILRPVENTGEKSHRTPIWACLIVPCAPWEIRRTPRQLHREIDQPRANASDSRPSCSLAYAGPAHFRLVDMTRTHSLGANRAPSPGIVELRHFPSACSSD